MDTADKKKDSPTPPASSTQPLVQGLREWITALISFAIVVVALWMLIDTYNSGKVVAVEASGKAQLDAFARQKDLLLYALALLGTVTGYYLGRVPAELHAQRAESEAKASQQQAEAARNSEANTKRSTVRSLTALKKKAQGMKPAESRIKFGASDAGAPAPGSAATSSDALELSDEIQMMIDRLE